MIQVIRKGHGGTVWTDFVGRQSGSCSVDVYNDQGAHLVTSGVGVPDSVNTTITAEALAGDTQLAVSSASGIQGGRRYLIGGEEVGVKSVSGATLTLWAPLERNHDAGVAFQGVRVSYVVLAGAAAAAWADGYVVFTADDGTEQTEALHCSLHTFPDAMISGYDTRQVMPAQDKALSANLDLDLAYRAARDNFLIDLGGKAVAYSHLGVAQFRRLVSMRFWLDRALEFGLAWSADMTEFEKTYQRLIDKVVSVSPVDADGDGKTTQGPEKHALGGLDLEAL